MKMVMCVQNSGVNNAALFQNEQTKASVDGLHSSNLLFLVTSRKMTTSNSIGRDSIEALPCLRTHAP
jgi:hypothetical protein